MQAIMCVGLPRSGKTTWCQKVASELGAAIINPDAFRLALHGQNFLKSGEGIVWATAELAFKAAFLAGHHTVILDATNLTVKRRQKWVETVQELTNFLTQDRKRIDIFYKSFDTTPEVCCERALACGRPDLVRVIWEMHGYRQPLTELDMPWKD